MAGWAWYSLPEVQGWSSVPGGDVKSGICRDSTGCDRVAIVRAAGRLPWPPAFFRLDVSVKGSLLGAGSHKRL